MNFAPTDLALALCLGLGVAASTGLNASLPLLLLSGAARFGIVPLNGSFQWLSSNTALTVLIIAAILEIIGDKIPALDHFLDAAGTFVRPVAGMVALSSSLIGVDPTTAAILGVIVGGPISFGFHSVKAGTRVASSAMTFGCANPVLSVIEDVISFVLTILAIFAPILVPLLLVVLAIIGWRVVARSRRSATPAV